MKTAASTAQIKFEGEVVAADQKKIKKLLFFKIFNNKLTLVTSIEKLRIATINLQKQEAKNKDKNNKELNGLIEKYKLNNVDEMAKKILKKVFQRQLKELINDVTAKKTELEALQKEIDKLTKKIEDKNVKNKAKNFQKQITANQAKQQTLKEEIEKMKKNLLEFVKEYKLRLTGTQNKTLKKGDNTSGTTKKKGDNKNKAIGEAMKGTGIGSKVVIVTPYISNAERRNRKKKKRFVDDDFLSLKF